MKSASFASDLRTTGLICLRDDGQCDNAKMRKVQLDVCVNLVNILVGCNPNLPFVVDRLLFLTSKLSCSYATIIASISTFKNLQVRDFWALVGMDHTRNGYTEPRKQ